MGGVAGTSTSALSALAFKQSVTASNIAKMNSTDYPASSVLFQSNGVGISASVVKGADTVDISKEAVDMISTGSAYKANLKVLKASDDMTRELLNILA